jgi:hypothetical protein
MTAVQEPRSTTLKALLRASADVRAARARLDAEQHEAWERYVAAVEVALADDLAVPTGDGDGSGEEDGWQEVLDVVRGHVDDLRVQARLGRMQAADLLEELHVANGWVLDRLRH